MRDLYESVDYKTLDLQADFDMLNKLMFDNSLKRVPLRIMNTKNVVGLMSYDKTSGERKVKDIGISNFFKMERQEYLNVLAHEMIHLWMEQNGIYERDPHGRKFLAKVAELNAKFPEFNIKKSENAGDYNVSSEKNKEYGVVIFDEAGVYSIVVVQPSVVEDEKALDDFIEGIKKYASHKFVKSLNINIYKSKYSDLSKWKVKKSLSLNSLALYVLTPEQASIIKSEGTEIRKIKIK